MRSSKYLLVCVLALALFSGCMGGGGVKNISVSITPTQATVNQGGTRQFNATVTGTPNKEVTWSISPENGGTITPDGLYQAPTTPGTYHVIATSKANPSKQAQAVVTVPEITVDVQPSSVTLDQGATQQFTAQVAGTINSGITWNVDPENGGTITENGLYTAPNTPGTYTVIAASAAEPAKRSEAEVTVREISIEIEPSEITLELDEEYQFTAVVRGTVDTGVDWSISPAGMGPITEDGLYTAPSTAGTYTVIATSKADQTKTA